MKSLPLSPLEATFLVAVRGLGADAYGQAIVDKASELAKVEIPYGSTYVTLGRLVTKGYLTQALGTRNRRYYNISQNGAEALHETQLLCTDLGAMITA
jgi:DNA-binding PadR family transcriptional regulator